MSLIYNSTQLARTQSTFFTRRLTTPRTLEMAQAPKAPEPTNSITLYGPANMTCKGKVDDIPDKGFTHVSMDGTDSIYYIYSRVNQGGSSTPSILHIVENTEKMPLVVMPPRSCKGFSKKGILLFSARGYGGNISQNFVSSGLTTSVFPVGSGNGVSSLRVFEGAWELLKKDESKIVIGGETKFWPGFQGDIHAGNDQLYQIRLVQ